MFNSSPAITNFATAPAGPAPSLFLFNTPPTFRESRQVAFSAGQSFSLVSVIPLSEGWFAGLHGRVAAPGPEEIGYGYDKKEQGAGS